MPNQKIGFKLRELREKKDLSLRKVSAMIDLDVAVLSKMERGERRLSKEVVQKLANVYMHDTEELMVLYLSERVVSEIGEEDLAIKALHVAEKKINYLKNDLK